MVGEKRQVHRTLVEQLRARQTVLQCNIPIVLKQKCMGCSLQIGDEGYLPKMPGRKGIF